MGSYSIWVMPSGQLKTQLQNQIDKLSDKYNTVKFEPHITLAGGFHAESENEAISKSQTLATQTKKFFLKFKDVSYGSIFTQCVYILINEDVEVMAAGKTAKEMFLEDASTTYMPHLSLIYSDMDQEQRYSLGRHLFFQCSSEKYVQFETRKHYM
eukprot:TRINITY_DN2454_c0_g1_i3.p2 TRINITY_DN2454_c0_g1~~TRINITY_DN2454_c0_g1_i3.p2  ORF type:complete len:172 (-),score=5.60 TRINITY_DN2454_c0_g1_i3:314-778(-)